jgi:TetR/AcrR family transcriptional regulator, tetracycline repressor protein
MVMMARQSADLDAQSVRRGPKPQFTATEIVIQALDVVRGTGLEGFSLRVLGDHLGISQMALYRYFSSKDELLEAMTAHALTPAATQSLAIAGWRERLSAAMCTFYEILTATPAVAELLATQVPGEVLDPFRHAMIGIAQRAGFSEQNSSHVLRALTNYVLGAALIATPRRGRADGSDESFLVGLSLLLDSIQRMPRNSSDSTTPQLD